MNANRTFYGGKQVDLSFKNVPNLSLKGSTFDADHLGRLVGEDEVGRILL